MNIGIVVWSIDAEGGTQRQTLNLAKALKNLGQKVTVYTFFYHPPAHFQKLLEGIEVKCLYNASELEFDQGQSLNGRNIFVRFFGQKIRTNILSKQLAQIVDPKTDVINPHDGCYRVCHYLKRINPKIKSVWMANDIHSLVWTAERFEKRQNIFQRVLRRLADIYEGRFIHQLDKIVVLDNLNQSVLQKYYGAESEVVRSGLDLSYFKFSGQRLPLSPTKIIRLLATGILAPHRRFEDILLAIAMLKSQALKIKLDIIGRYSAEDLYKQKLDLIIKDYHLENDVTFKGFVSEKELLLNYQNHHIFIFANHNQTWGLAVFEAMACGLPVIVSRTSGASEVLTHGENAWLVNPKSPKEIAEGVKTLVSDPELYKRISQNAVAFVNENITWEKYAKQMLKIMEETVNLV